MKQKYFLDSISDETLADMIDKTIRFEKAQKTKQSKISVWKIIPAAAVIVLVIGLVNLLPIFQPPEVDINGVGTEITSDNYEKITDEIQPTTSDNTMPYQENAIDFKVSIHPTQYNENPFTLYNYSLVNKVITSFEEFESMLNDEYYSFEEIDGTGQKSTYLRSLTYFYDNEYFKENALVVVTFDYKEGVIPKFIYKVDRYETSLTAWAHSFEDMDLPENEKFKSGLYTARVFLIQVNKSDVEGVTEVYPGIDCAPVIILDETIIGDLIIFTEKGQEPIQNADGTITLPNGGRYKLPNGDEVSVWSSITIQSDGKIDKSLPVNKGKRITIVRANGDIIAVEANGAVMIKGEYIEDFDIDIILNNVRTPDYEYMLQSDNTIMITRYIGDENTEEIIIPGEIDGIKVTSIADETFSYYDNIRSVTIPDSVTRIWDNAFMSCNNLTAFNVDINNPVYSSLDGVVFNKDKTKIVYFPSNKSKVYVIPDTVKSIGSHAFAGSTLMSVTIPGSVTDIGYCAFIACRALSSVILPDSLKYIGVIAFKDCIGLTSLTIPGSVETIDVSAFMCCTGLTEVIIEDGVKNINGGAFSHCGDKLTSVTIPDSVTHIGDSEDDDLKVAAPAFWDCPNLTVYCSEGSYAHGYCVENGIKAVLR